jgi:polysaccharide biosynthesis/export protein VpsN
VINAGGGFTEYANRKKVRLLRDGKVTVVDVTAIIGDPAKDIPLKPGDSIEVPQSFW